jgi:hypothetical protein
MQVVTGTLPFLSSSARTVEDGCCGCGSRCGSLVFFRIKGWGFKQPWHQSHQFFGYRWVSPWYSNPKIAPMDVLKRPTADPIWCAQPQQSCHSAGNSPRCWPGKFSTTKNQSGQMQLEVSENGGTPKWMVYFIMENPTKNGWFWGTAILGLWESNRRLKNHPFWILGIHIHVYMYIYIYTRIYIYIYLL